MNLIERLRIGQNAGSRICEEAADELERLQADLRDVMNKNHALMASNADIGRKDKRISELESNDYRQLSLKLSEQIAELRAKLKSAGCCCYKDSMACPIHSPPALFKADMKATIERKDKRIAVMKNTLIMIRRSKLSELDAFEWMMRDIDRALTEEQG